MRYPDRKDIILVTGGTGQLGYAWVEQLRSEGMTVLCPDRRSMDLSQPDEVSKWLITFQPTFIIHCGAYTKVDLAEDEAEICFSTNRDSTGVLARFAAENDIPLMYYSTDYVFAGESSDMIAYPDGYPVEAPAAPIGVYGASKWQGECLIREAQGDHLIIRVAWLCGAHGSNFVKTMLRLGSTRNELNVVNDQIGSPSFVNDVISFSQKMLNSEGSGTLHISSNGMISWADFASEVFSYSNFSTKVIPIPTSQYPTKAKRPLYSKLDCSTTESLVGESLPDWKDSLHRLIEEIQELK